MGAALAKLAPRRSGFNNVQGQNRNIIRIPAFRVKWKKPYA
jgi:hypothetical protein